MYEVGHRHVYGNGDGQKLGAFKPVRSLDIWIKAGDIDGYPGPELGTAVYRIPPKATDMGKAKKVKLPADAEGEKAQEHVVGQRLNGGGVGSRSLSRGIHEQGILRAFSWWEVEDQSQVRDSVSCPNIGASPPPKLRCSQTSTDNYIIAKESARVQRATADLHSLDESFDIFARRRSSKFQY